MLDPDGVKEFFLSLLVSECLNIHCFFEGNVDGGRFEQFLRDCVLPILNSVNPHSCGRVL